MKVVRSVKLVMVSTIVRHLFLGPQHALVWDTSVATMTKLVNKTLRSFECGRTFDTWLNSALGITLKQSTEFMVGGRLDVGIIEDFTEGIVVGGEDTRIRIRERDKRNFNLGSFTGLN